jgi:translation initiation factor IF-1
MAREDAIEVEGAVVEALPHALYRVELANGHRVLAHWLGKARRNPIPLAPGDKVKLEMSPFDLSKGGIIWNEKEI